MGEACEAKGACSVSKHTPGPWIAEPDGEDDWKVRSEDYGTIVHRNCYPEPKVDTTVEADAKLIAAAPELLAACEYVAGFKYAMTREQMITLAKRCEAAIAKAKGEPK